MNRVNQVFLCHAKEDEAKVLAIYERLKQHGIKLWMDKKDLLPGQQWELEIAKAIRESDFVLLFFSRTSISKRGYVQKEFRIALDVYDQIPEGRIFLVPVRLDDCEIPERFKELQYCDLFDEDSFDKILRAIQPFDLNSEDVWQLSFNLDFADILLKFAVAGEGIYRAREILSLTQYTVWKKLIHWGFVDSPKKGFGRITERGRKFLRGEIDIPVKLDIRNNNVVNQSRERVSINHYYPGGIGRDLNEE